MLESPFACFRGAAAVMAADLGSQPSSGLTVQLCGDAHLSNFGAFASPDRALVFDLNDFDETLPGPFDWDVKRLATSFALTGRAHGMTEEARRDLVIEVVGWYRRAMREFASLTNVAVWYARLDATRVMDMLGALRGTRSAKYFEQARDKARSRDNTRAVGRLTEVVDGRLRIVSKPPLI